MREDPDGMISEPCEVCTCFHCGYCDGVYVENGESREHTLHDCESIQRLKEEWKKEESK